MSGDLFFVETFYSDVKVDAQNLEWRHLCQMQNAGDRWLNFHSNQVSCAMYVPKMTYFFATAIIFIMFCPIHAQEMCVRTKQR